jgi:putative ABC transport system permease protein
MTWVALRSLAARRTRAVLTALAIVLGVAMIAGSLILTDTIDRAFTTIFSSSYTQTDLVVRGDPVVSGSVSGAPTVPASLLPRVRALPGVAAAAGSLVDLSGTGSTAKLVGADGRVIAGVGPSFGFGVDPAQPRFNPLTLTDGRWAARGDQVVVDAGTASHHHLHVGDPVGVSGVGPVRHMTISGIARFGGVDSLGGATIAVFDLPTARAVLGKTGFDAIQVATAPGVSKDAVAREIAPLLPRDATVQTAAQQASADKESISEAMTFIRGFLLSFGGIALFVGAFVIFNTLSITVAQRSRELATLRTLGASRAQVLRSVVAEALAIGVAASLAGLALGWALARGLSAVFSAFGAEMPQGDTVFALRTVVVALATGTLVTLVAGLAPAVRATRVAPIAAVREGAESGTRRGSRRSLVAALTISGLAGTLLASGATGDGLGGGARALAIGAGALGLFVGLGMLSPRLVRPLAAVVGWPVARLGASGALARENAVRNPSRTASTAAALMIGLALVTVVAVIGAGLLSSAEDGVKDQVTADWVVTSSNGYDPVPVAAGEALAAAPGVRVASSVRHDRARVAGSAEEVGGVDPSTIARTFHFDWAPGSSGAALARLGHGGVLVTRDLAEAHDLRVGSPVPIVTPGGHAVRRTVAGIYDPPRLASLLGAAVLSQRDFDVTFPRPSDSYTLVAGADRGALEAALAGFPDAKVATVAGFTGTYLSDLHMIINMLYVLLALSVIVSLFGMVNTLVLSVHERTREIGMLRAVGMTRRQTRRMVRGESVVTALIGAALGIPLGVGVAAVVVGSLSDLGVGLVVPVASLAAFTLVAVLAGVLAAVTPARRASRLDVLRALQYQ